MAVDEYHVLEAWQTPRDKAGTGNVSKKEFQNFINTTNQCLNNLKIKPSTTPKASGSEGEGGKKGPKCFDCGKMGEKIGHSGCPNPGERLHLPGKFKNKSKFQSNNSNKDKGSDQPQHPTNEEKTEDLAKYVPQY